MWRIGFISSKFTKFVGLLINKKNQIPWKYTTDSCWKCVIWDERNTENESKKKYYIPLSEPTFLFCRTKRFVTTHYTCSYFEKRVSGKMCTRQSRKAIWDMINTLFLTIVAVAPTKTTGGQTGSSIQDQMLRLPGYLHWWNRQKP